MNVVVRHRVALFWILLSLVLVVATSWFSFSGSEKVAGAIQAGVYMSTLLALLWYSYETRLMRINQLKPFLLLRTQQPPGMGMSFAFIKNIGSGPAYDLRLVFDGVYETGGRLEQTHQECALGLIERDQEIQIATRLNDNDEFAR